MTKRGEWDRAASDAAAAVERSRDAGEQLGLFGTARDGDADRALERAEARRGGRPQGARNKAKVGLAEYMAAQGYRAPGQQVALAAGLGEEGDPLEIAFRRAVWLQQAAVEQVTAGMDDLGEVERRRILAEMASGLVGLTAAIWREQNAAAAQLLPYTMQKLAPAEPAKPEADRPRLGIAPPSAQLGAAVARAALVPADVRAGFERNQGLGGDAPGASDDGSSDDDASN